MRVPLCSKMKLRWRENRPEIAAPGPCHKRLKTAQTALKILSIIMLFVPVALLGVEYFGGNVPFAFDLLVDLIPLFLASLVGTRLVRVRYISAHGSARASGEATLSLTPADDEMEE